MNSSKDIVLSTVGAEEPVLHTVKVNDTAFTVAIELQHVVLLGCPVRSANSEYRNINLNARKANQLLKGELKKQCGIYYRLRSAISACTKHNTLSIRDQEIINVSGHGICYAFVYFLLLKHFGHTNQQSVDLINFATMLDMTKLFNAVLKKHKIGSKDLANFASEILAFESCTGRIGSKLLTVTHHQMDDTSNLHHSLWKVMYINRIIRGIPTSIRKSYLSPSLDWGVMSHPSARLFTNPQLISRLNFGSAMEYVVTSSQKQHQLGCELVRGPYASKDLEAIAKLTRQLKEASKRVDYSLDDISFVVFNSNAGVTFYNAANAYIKEAKDHAKSSPMTHAMHGLFADIEIFKQTMFQSLYCMLLLAQHGVIHNDPHLNHILVTPHQGAIPLEQRLPSGRVVKMGRTSFEVTFIDFDKSILSHEHHDFFDAIRSSIEKEICVVFDAKGKAVVDNEFQVFNCYAMYDVIRLCLVMNKILQDATTMLSGARHKLDISKQKAFLSKTIKLAMSTLKKIYEHKASFPFDLEQTHGSMVWLLETMFKDYISSSKSGEDNSESRNLQPSFVSSRRKFADKLKYQYISDYVAKNRIRSNMST